MSKNKREPFEALGAKLKHLREQWNQSVREVSSTLEIDEKTLAAIEAGKTMPEENLLDMLINHFLLTDEQADEIRDLVDSYKDQTVDGLMTGIEDMLNKQLVMYMPMDGRIIYTDSMQATVNKNGVVLQFMQAGPQTNQQPMLVNRVGMSRDHAERMIQVLRDTLDQHDRAQGAKTLPDPKKDKQ